MTNPITPPPELVQQWASKWLCNKNVNRDNFMTTRAAQWGADQELEACCEWLMTDRQVLAASALGAARRPKPPSLKGQALHAANLLFSDSETGACAAARDTIRRALEALPDD
jgi:hypothetical protein